jgi:hypothetical protein
MWVSLLVYTCAVVGGGLRLLGVGVGDEMTDSPFINSVASGSHYLAYQPSS